MQHQTSRHSADRHGNSLSRATIEEVDDTKFVQEHHHRLFHDEQHDETEHVHPYGFTAVVQKPTGKGMFRQAADAFLSFLGSNRTHGIAIVAADRRYRLYKLKDGEVALHDDQGHQVHIARDGVYVSAPKSKKVIAQIMADDQLPQDSKAEPDGQKLGQIAQKGRAVHASFTLDKDSFTVSHPAKIVHKVGDTTLTLLPGSAVIKSTKIVTDGKTYVGGEDGAKKIVRDGDPETNLATTTVAYAK